MKKILCAVMMFIPAIAHAGDTLVISNASNIKFAATNDQKVYLRNLDQYDNSWLGCCNFYWIDISTDWGKAQYANLLSAKYSGSRLGLYINSKTSGGAFLQIGDF